MRVHNLVSDLVAPGDALSQSPVAFILPHPDDHLRGRHVPAIDHAAALNKSNPQQSRPDDHHVAHHEHDHAVDRMGRARRRSSLLGASPPSSASRGNSQHTLLQKKKDRRRRRRPSVIPIGQRHAPCSEEAPDQKALDLTNMKCWVRRRLLSLALNCWNTHLIAHRSVCL